MLRNLPKAALLVFALAAPLRAQQQRSIPPALLKGGGVLVHTDEDVASAISDLEQWVFETGFARQVGAAVSKILPAVHQVLEWAPASGVLIEVDIQEPEVQPDSHRMVDLMGDPYMVGAGTSAIAVDTLALTKSSYLPDTLALKKDWQLSTQESYFLWVTHEANGLKLTRFGYDHVKRGAVGNVTDDAMKAQVRETEEREMALQLAESAVRKAGDEKTQAVAARLLRDARESVQKVADIDAKLDAEVSNANDLRHLATIISAVGSFASSVATEIDTASSVLGADHVPSSLAQAQSPKEFSNALKDEITKSNGVVMKLQQDKNGVHQELEIKLQESFTQGANMKAPPILINRFQKQ